MFQYTDQGTIKILSNSPYSMKKYHLRLQNKLFWAMFVFCKDFLLDLKIMYVLQEAVFSLPQQRPVYKAFISG